MPNLPKNELEAVEAPERRWYHLRPVPRRRDDLMGFNRTWWTLFWLILIVLILYPLPFWL